MGDFTSAVEYFDQSIEITEKLNDIWNLHSTLHNLGEAQCYNTDYSNALSNFKRALKISYLFDDNFILSDGYKSIGMVYLSLASYDSTAYYLGKADSILVEYPVIRLPVLSWLAITFMKDGQKSRAKNYIKIFDELIEEFEPISKDIISLNWNMYQVHELLGDPKSGREYLENSYLEIRSRSKNIKNKADRDQYLSVKLHQDIIAVWDN